MYVNIIIIKIPQNIMLFLFVSKEKLRDEDVIRGHYQDNNDG